MTFEAFQWVFLLLLVPVLALMYGYAHCRKRRDLRVFVSAGRASGLVDDNRVRRKVLQSSLLVMATAFMVLALMRPQWGEAPGEASSRGRDIYIVLDVSLSMLATDATPSRLAVAKGAIRRFVQAVANAGGHRVALVLFAGRASLQGPLTTDYQALLIHLDRASPDAIELVGTQLGDSLVQTMERFVTGDPAYADIVLVSDGEDHGARVEMAETVAARRGLRVHSVAIGDSRTGAAIPHDTALGGSGFLEREGRRVISRMQPTGLIRIAERTGGIFVPANSGANRLVNLFEEQIANAEDRPIGTPAELQLAERYQWFAGLALLLLALESLIRARRSPEH